MRSVAGSFSLVCNFYAMTRLPVGDVLTLTNMYPLWILLLSAGLLRLWPTAAELVGIGCGLAGVALIQQPRLDGDYPAVAAVLASLSSAVALLGLHRLRGVGAPAIVVHFAGVAGAIAAAWMLVRGGPFLAGALTPGTALMLLGVGLSGTAGQFFLTRAYAAAPPTRLSVIGLSQVAFGLGFDAVIWHRALTPAGAVGMLLVPVPTAWLSTRAGDRHAEVGAPGEPAPVPEPSCARG